jgi:hypothetical protein
MDRASYRPLFRRLLNGQLKRPKHNKPKSPETTPQHPTNRSLTYHKSNILHPSRPRQRTTKMQHLRMLHNPMQRTPQIMPSNNLRCGWRKHQPTCHRCLQPFNADGRGNVPRYCSTCASIQHKEYCNRKSRERYALGLLLNKINEETQPLEINYL